MSVVVIPSQLFALLLLWLIVDTAIAVGLVLYFLWQSRRLVERQDKIEQAARAELMRELAEEQETLEQPVWKRYSAPLDDPTPTLAHRIMKRDDSVDHYPFRLPHLEPATPLPDVMRIPSVPSKVVMRTNDHVETRDQYGFVMQDLSGLYGQVYLNVMSQYNGLWLVPKEKTGYHKITRFKYVRPQDYPGPPWKHPRDLPEISPPWPLRRPSSTDELSPA